MKNKKQNSKALSGGVVLSKSLAEAVDLFREYHPATRFSRNLRNLLIEFLMYDGAIEANYLQDLLYDLQGLFDLLEVIQSEEKTG